MSSKARQFAYEVVQRLLNAGYEACWAGGCVRDLLLGHDPKDYDVATNATPTEVRRLFGHRRTLAVGESFGVIMVLPPGKGIPPVEVATFRSDDSYTDGRRPDSVTYCSAREDALRRDFTINGMFYDPVNEKVIDYVSGQADLQAGIVRAIGDPIARMTEDKLRMLRAVRFTARFQFQLDEATAYAVNTMADQIEVVSRERIAQELRGIFRHPGRARAVELMEQLQLLLPIFPVLHDFWKHPYNQETIRLLRKQTSESFELSLAILLRKLIELPGERNSPPVELVKQVCKELKLSNAESETVSWLVEHQDSLNEAPALPLHQLKPLLNHPDCELLLEWLRAREQLGMRNPGAWQFCRNYLEKTPSEKLAPPPLVTGKDLIEAGYQPGPEFGEMLHRARIAQLDEVVRTREEGLRFLGIEKRTGE